MAARVGLFDILMSVNISKSAQHCAKGACMSRVQLALNVDDLDASIAFYSAMFQVKPHKVRSDYANFIVDNPPLKLVLIAGKGEPGTMNHVGVEVDTTAEVVQAAELAQTAGIATTLQEKETCCYALQDKVWIHGPNLSWEIYTVLDENAGAGSMAMPRQALQTLDFINVSGGSCAPGEACCPTES
jgi:catechol 2,3-dioxygenase-like lactoylglutathione lyase family enzyme